MNPKLRAALAALQQLYNSFDDKQKAGSTGRCAKSGALVPSASNRGPRNPERGDATALPLRCKRLLWRQQIKDAPIGNRRLISAWSAERWGNRLGVLVDDRGRATMNLLPVVPRVVS